MPLSAELYVGTAAVFALELHLVCVRREDGQFEIQGAFLAMKDAASVLTSKDTCRREWNYVKHPLLLQSTYQWRLGRTQYGFVLILRGHGGKDTMYLRETEPGLSGGN